MGGPRNASDAAVIDRHSLAQRCAAVERVVLAAPPGYGKTVFAAQIAALVGGPTVWCRCIDGDHVDGGAGRVLTALTDAFPRLGREAPIADTTGPARLAYAAEVIAGPATVVLDDVHLLGEAVNATLWALDTDPRAGLTIVVATDGRPPRATVDWVSQGRGLVVGPDELRFGLDDCAALVGRTGSDQDPASLLERSGGWPIAAAALAHGATVVGDQLAELALDELGGDALDALASLAHASSVPAEVVAAGPHGAELNRFARRHPALVDVAEGRWAVRELLRPTLVARPVPADAMVHLADQLERKGELATGLTLLARLPDPDRAALQERLERDGGQLIAGGRFALIHQLVGAVPPERRSPTVVLVDLMASLGLDQLERSASGPDRVDEAAVDRFLERVDLRDDHRLAAAGIRTRLLRNDGDPRMVAAALGALEGVGPLGAGTTAADLVEGRDMLARMGLAHALCDLGSAALYSGDPATVTEGVRLVELGHGVAEQAGLDPAPLRGQFAYDSMAMGMRTTTSVLGPLEMAIAARVGTGHPEAANLLCELADVHRRRGELAQATAAADAAVDWSERTGNALVRSSIDLVRAGIALNLHGPSPALDRRFDEAWTDLVASGRLRRAAPGFAVRVANSFLDHDDTARAARWLDRAETLLGTRVQTDYQLVFIRSVRRRLAALIRAQADPSAAWPDEPQELPDHAFHNQPVGRLEVELTTAWDRLRHGDGSAARLLLAQLGDDIEPPWGERLRANGATERRRPGLRLRLMCAELRVERDGRRSPSPTGHAARLLALLTVRGGAMPVEAAIEDLWPDADPAAARNRFHQVLLRTRRALGVEAGGPVTVVDGVLRLNRDQVSTDLWDLQELGGRGPAEARQLLDEVESELCSAQFAYDEAFDEARWQATRLVVDAARLALTPAGGEEGLESVVRLWGRGVQDPRLGIMLTGALEQAGRAEHAVGVRAVLGAHPEV